jgi:2-methylaconitate cis-trans-isomerase PrpF
MHTAYAVTGGIAVGAAALIEGTVVNEVVGARAKTSGVVRVGHPSGVSEFVITVVKKPSGEFELTTSGVAGTSRRIMDGYAYVPRRIMFLGE